MPTLQRNTKQKQAIQHVLEHTKAPLLPPEILALAALEVPNMGIATVYRSLKNLVEEGKVHVVARVLSVALKHRDVSFSSGILRAAGEELQRFNRGISVLDTVVTLAPLLGLFGTVTGMIRAFGLLGASELGAPTQITGGIAEALIATAFGLLIAMLALLPFNYLNSRLEQARQEIESAAAYLEILLVKAERRSAERP